MAFTEKKIPVSRNYYFEYYDSDTLSIDQSFDPSTPFELDSIKLHMSVVHPSVVDLRVWVSSILGSAYDLVLLSLAMSDVKDVLWGPDRTMILNYGDALHISMNESTGIVWGLLVNGWSIT